MISHEESKAAIGIDGRGWATSSLIRIRALSDRREWKRWHPIHHFHPCTIIFLMVLGNHGDVIAIYIDWWSHLNICLVRHSDAWSCICRIEFGWQARCNWTWDIDILALLLGGVLQGNWQIYWKHIARIRISAVRKRFIDGHGSIVYRHRKRYIPILH